MSITAREMRYRLRRRFEQNTDQNPMPSHAVMFEVAIDGVRRWQHPDGSATLQPVKRRIDAVAVGLWAKTQYLVHGVEIKVSRGDLLSELREPEKAATAANTVDRWWLALGDRTLLRDNDPLPDGWGVLAASGRGLTVVREPAPQAGERSRQFIASMLQASFRSHGACRWLGYQDGKRDGISVGRYNEHSRYRIARSVFNRAVDALADVLPSTMGGTPDLFAPACERHGNTCADPWQCWSDRASPIVADYFSLAKE